MDSLVTDRTPANVRGRDDKGYYNTDDLNRVEKAVVELAERVREYFPVPELTAKTDWSAPDPYKEYNEITDGEFFTPSQRTRYLNNVQEVVSAIKAGKRVSLPFSMDNLTHEGANEIEKALVIVDDILNSPRENWVYCGVEFTGGDYKW